MIREGLVLKDKYKIIHQLGQGGMAEVWLAEEITFGNRQVAIKVPKPSISEQESQILQARFQREVQVAAELSKADTPNVVKALTAEPFEDTSLLVMEYMPGGDLSQMITEHPNGMPINEVLKISTDILTALNAIHNHPQAIVHRDIKPSNILFDSKGIACLADFGLAQMGKSSSTTKVFASLSIPFTPLYRAPELSIPDGIALSQSDIFSFGCVLFEMLTGRTMRQSRPGTSPSTFNNVVPGWLDQLTLSCLMEDPWDRPMNATGLIQLFNQHNEIPYQVPVIANSQPLPTFSTMPVTFVELTSSPPDKPITWTNNYHLHFIGIQEGSGIWEDLHEEAGVVTLPAGYQLGICQQVSSKQELVKLISFIQGFQLAPIRALNLSHSAITSNDLAALSKLTSLRNLNLLCCREITDAGLAHLANLVNLTDLDISFCHNFGNPGLAYLTKLVQLTSINLECCDQITDIGLTHLSKLTNLKKINFAHCEQITDSGLAHLNNLSKPISLTLIACKHISDTGLVYLGELTNLSVLNLGDCDKITDVGLSHLSRLTHLTFLNLEKCNRITNYGLEYLSRLDNLAILILEGCEQITDAGIAHLARLTKLTHLNLGFCNQISPYAKMDLKKQIPDLTIDD